MAFTARAAHHAAEQFKKNLTQKKLNLKDIT
jgi:hypothetical protein